MPLALRFRAPALKYGLVFLPLIAAACGGDGAPAGMVRLAAVPSAPVTSLAGEILSPDRGADCATVLAAWVKSADGNGDGLLDLAEAQADSARFFARIDTNGDHILTPIELSGYRDSTAPTAYADRAIRDTHFVSNDDDGSKAKRETRSTASSFTFRAEPDPVMAADGNLDFHVTPDELAAKVAERFIRLDANRDGRLDAAELAAFCPG